MFLTSAKNELNISLLMLCNTLENALEILTTFWGVGSGGCQLYATERSKWKVDHILHIILVSYFEKLKCWLYLAACELSSI